jgi:hypothetical protein
VRSHPKARALCADTGAVKRAGTNKASREKLRRERLNERFSELGALLDLTGASVDKLRVLSEAISTLKSLREEVQQPHRWLAHPHSSSHPAASVEEDFGCFCEGWDGSSLMLGLHRRKSSRIPTIGCTSPTP